MMYEDRITLKKKQEIREMQIKMAVAVIIREEENPGSVSSKLLESAIKRLNR